MYKIARPPESEPKILIDNGVAWTAHFIERRKRNAAYKYSWIKKGVNYHDELVKALGNLTADHCSYCDKYPLDERAKIDNQIDHFKPLSLIEFIYLAYDWANLYLSCGGCNKSKLAQFSDLILRPDEEGYVPSDYFFFDTSTGEILLNETKGEEYTARAEKTIAIFDLNNPSIVKMRLLAIRNYLRDKKTANELLNINDYDFRNFIEYLL